MFYVGLDLGQRQDHSAVAIVERPKLRHAWLATRQDHLLVRRVERLALGTPYPRVVERVREIVCGTALAGQCALVVDGTGVGAPVVDMLRRAGLGCEVTAVTITGGEKESRSGAAWNVPSLYAIRFLFGAGEAGCFPNLTRMLSAWLPARERVTAQSLMWACTRWGGAATPPLALLFITWLGWRWAFVAFAALGLVWCCVFLLWFKDDPAQHGGVNTAERELLERSRTLTTHAAGQRHWISLLLTRQVSALVLQYFCFSYVWYFYITWLPTYLREGRGQSPARAAALAVLPLLFGGFGSLATGLAPMRIPRRIGDSSIA